MVTLPQLHDPPPGEGCGPCTACCDVIGVDELGKPPYARCPHLDLTKPHAPCGVYEQRPMQCRRYRCVWHLGILGPRTDRRPDQSGIVFQLEPEGGQWRIAAYETKPGAATPDRLAYLVQLIVTSKKARHLSILPDVHVMTFGADLPVDFPVSPIYGYEPPPSPARLKRQGLLLVFDGKSREMLMPTGNPSEGGSDPTQLSSRGER